MSLIHDFLTFFITDASAATAPPSQQGGSFSFVLMTAVLILFMYFVMWRPQSKRARDHRNLVTALAKGDEVITAGGILGRVSKVTDSYIILALTEHVEIAVQKSAIVNALPKGTIKSIT